MIKIYSDEENRQVVGRSAKLRKSMQHFKNVFTYTSGSASAQR
jgi:hypothetical protein